VSNESTIGASFIVNYSELAGNNPVRLNIWDTAGQERYAMLLPMYSRNADVIIFTIDPLNSESVEYIKKITPIVMSASIIAIHLVVTKMDNQYNDKHARELVDDVKAFLREFLREEDEVVVNDYYTSAITCYNVEQPFITNCQDIIRRKVKTNCTRVELEIKENNNNNKCNYC